MLLCFKERNSPLEIYRIVTQIFNYSKIARLLNFPAYFRDFKNNNKTGKFVDSDN